VDSVGVGQKGGGGGYGLGAVKVCVHEVAGRLAEQKADVGCAVSEVPGEISSG
jgi:hypothetical protein